MGLIDAHDKAENDLNKIADDITDMAQHVALTEVPLDEWGGFQIISKVEEKGYTAVKIPKQPSHFPCNARARGSYCCEAFSS